MTLRQRSRICKLIDLEMDFSRKFCIFYLFGEYCFITINIKIALNIKFHFFCIQKNECKTELRTLHTSYEGCPKTA